jgi:hypothetical protein
MRSKVGKPICEVTPENDLAFRTGTGGVLVI